MSGRSTRASLAAEAASTLLETMTCAYSAPKKRRNAWRKYSSKCLNSWALPTRLASARRPLQRLLPPRPHLRPLVLGAPVPMLGTGSAHPPCLLRQLLTTPYARHWQGKRRLDRLLRRPTSGPRTYSPPPGRRPRPLRPPHHAAPIASTGRCGSRCGGAQQRYS